ncbi:MAG: hypothetical protein ABI227_11905 [Rhodanobacter sp.]
MKVSYRTAACNALKLFGRPNKNYKIVPDDAYAGFPRIRNAPKHHEKSNWRSTLHTLECPFAMHSSTMNTYAGNGLPVGGGPTMAATSTDYRHMHACRPSQRWG